MEKDKKSKKISKLTIILIISISIIIVITGIFFMNREEINNISQQKNYNVNVEKIAIATLNDDDIFYTKLKDDYNGFKLIFVSVNIKNNASTNYDNLSYKLITSNNNEYNRASSYVTDDENFIENYNKINNKIFNDSTDDLLGNENKRMIIGFMIPENEIINDTEYTLIIDSFELENGDVERIKFNSNEIIKSYTMKELYKENELERAEQTISLAYLASMNDWLTWTAYLEQAYNYQYDDLFITAFSAIKAFADSADYNYGWNGRKVETDGYRLDFDKAKEIYPNIADEIEDAKNATNAIKELYESYDNTINSLDKKKLTEMDSNIISFYNIDQYFGLRYTT